MADEKAAAVKAKAKVLDFTNVKDRGMYNPVQQEEGDYKLQIASCVEQDSKKGDPMWVFGFALVGSKTAVYPYYCILNEDNLWKVRNLIEATGKAVPKKRLKFDPQSIVGKFVGGTLEDDEYDGKTKSVIAALFPVSELDDEEEEAPPAKKKAPAKKAPVKKKKPEPEEEEEDDVDDDEEDVDDDELEEIEVDEL